MYHNLFSGKRQLFVKFLQFHLYELLCRSLSSDTKQKPKIPDPVISIDPVILYANPQSVKYLPITGILESFIKAFVF